MGRRTHLRVSVTCGAGETEGLAQLGRLLAGAAPAGRSFAASFSTKVSPWLALGCLSPRRMLAEVSLQPSCD